AEDGIRYYHVTGVQTCALPIFTHTQRPTFTAWTTRVSNPVRSPRFRSSASVSAQRPAFATGVPPDICAFHRYTRNSSLPCRTQVMPVSTARSGLSPKFSRPTRHTAYELFTPNNSGQRSHPTYYRGCWHVVGRCFFYRYRHSRFVPVERGLQPEGRHPPRGVAASGFRPLRNIPHCCLP